MTYDFFFGWKEKKWSPRKPSVRYDRRNSTLSWGNESKVISPYDLSEEFLESLGPEVDQDVVPAKESFFQIQVSETALKGGADTQSFNDALTRMADWSDVPDDEELRMIDGKDRNDSDTYLGHVI